MVAIKRNNQNQRISTSPRLSPVGIKRIQDIVGTFWRYARATDPIMEKALSSKAGQQAKAAQQLKEEIEWFLDYCATHPDAITRYHASDMRLALHSDGSYLSEPNSKSRAAVHDYLCTKQIHKRPKQWSYLDNDKRYQTSHGT